MQNPRPSILATSIAAAFVALAGLSQTAQAVPSFFWDTNGAPIGLGGNGNWDLVTSNWNANASGTGATTVWTNGSNAIFDGTVGTVTVTAPVTVGGSMTFNTAGYVIGGASTLTLTATNISGVGAVTINGPVAGSFSVTGAATVLNLNGVNTLAGVSSLTNGTLLLGNNSALGTATLNITGGTLGSNVGGLNVANALTIAGDFNVTPASGGLTLSGPVGLGAVTHTITNTTVQNSAFEATFSGVLSGAAGVTFDAPSIGYFRLAGTAANTYTGLTTVQGTAKLNLSKTAGVNAIAGNVLINGSGLLQLLASNQIADTATVTDNGVFNLASSAETIKTLLGTGRVDLSSTGILTVGDGSFSGVIDDNVSLPGGVLVKNTAGVLILSGANTYTGGTVIQDGTLKAGAANTLPTAGLVTLNKADGNGNAVLDLNGFNQTIGGLKIIAPENTSDINLNGATLTLAGDVNLVDNTTAPGNGTGSSINGGGALDLGGATRTFTIAGQNVDQEELTINVPIQNGALTFNGLTSTHDGSDAGLFLKAVSTYTGDTRILSGTLKAGVAGAVPKFSEVYVNGTFDLNGFNQSVGGISAGGLPVQAGTAHLILLHGAMLTTGNNNEDTTFDGTISDGGTAGGSVVKVGAGTWKLMGNSTYAGNTTVNGGGLIVNGSLASANVTVNALGLLGGSGVLGGNVVNNGTVSPGNSPGTLTVKGNYTQSPTGTLTIEVAGKAAGQHDLLAVGGKAKLDGSLRLIQVGSPRLHVGNKVTFVTAAGGVQGRFANVTNNVTDGTLLKSAVLYNAHDVQLAVTGTDFARLTGLTYNQRHTAAMLDAIGSNPHATRLLNYLSDRAPGSLPGDLDRLAPEELASAFNIGVSLGNVQTANLERRMDDVRAGSAGFSAGGYAMNGSSAGYSGTLGAGGPAGKGGKELLAPADNRLGVFITGVGEFTSIGDTSNARGYDLTTGGVTLGVDYKITPNFALGVNAGYARTGADLARGGRLTVDGAKLGVYATYFTEGFYADAAVSGGLNGYDTSRRALVGTARGSTDGGELNALAATGYDWKTGGLTFGPTVNFQYTYMNMNGFTEHGSLAPLRLATNHGESLRTAVGGKAAYDWHVGGVTVRPEARAAWQHECGDSTYGITSRLTSGAGGNFTVASPEVGRDSLLVGAGVAVLWNERTSTYVYYDGDLVRKNYSSHNVSGGVRLSF